MGDQIIVLLVWLVGIGIAALLCFIIRRTCRGKFRTWLQAITFIFFLIPIPIKVKETTTFIIPGWSVIVALGGYPLLGLVILAGIAVVWFSGRNHA